MVVLTIIYQNNIRKQKHKIYEAQQLPTISASVGAVAILLMMFEKITNII